MTDPSRAQTVDTEIAKHCAYSLPGVALTLGRQNWHCLKDTYETLASDMQVMLQLWKWETILCCALAFWTFQKGAGDALMSVRLSGRCNNSNVSFSLTAALVLLFLENTVGVSAGIPWKHISKKHHCIIEIISMNVDMSVFCLWIMTCKIIPFHFL